VSVEVLIPWRGSCVHRGRAINWVLDRYADRHPDWRLLLAPDVGPGPWVKGRATAAAADVTEGDIVIVADADVWCEGIEYAVDAVIAGNPWAIPHHRVNRLTPAATDRVLAGGSPWQEETEERPYIGICGGGLVVLRRATLLSIPIDHRFEGWGGEDISWGLALNCVAGRPWRGVAPLVHLWHPAQQRRTRRHGSVENEMLRRRYFAARRDPDRMRDLLAEVAT
jgi:hypothetical protein